MTTLESIVEVDVIFTGTTYVNILEQ